MQLAKPSAFSICWTAPPPPAPVLSGMSLAVLTIAGTVGGLQGRR